MDRWRCNFCMNEWCTCRECAFPGCNMPCVERSAHCEQHRNEPDDCVCHAGAPFHTDERCSGFRG
jgi:hypothetical protein